ncbi:aminopeptidase P family protein [Candidatus Saccharibacteria bacterium]|nr:aminopeptidase P family protein [Candidatus Saccharibacteria bacterium]
MIPNPFNAGFYSGNRRALSEQLPDNAVVILGAHQHMQEAADINFGFRQEPNFQYLTGIIEPDWRLVIDKAKGQSMLVRPQMNEVHEAFNGLLTAEEAIVRSGVDRVMTQAQYLRWLKSAVAAKKTFFTLFPQTRLARFMHIALNPSPRLLVRHLKAHGATPQDCRRMLSKLRAIKQAPEIEALQAAIDITNAGLEAAIARRHDFRYEYEYEAIMSYEFLRHGAEGVAWKPIVAAGKNSCIMHHPDNMGRIKSGDWIVTDVGARVHGYVADVARTFPTGKKSAAWQRDIHAAAVAYHDEAMALIQPGRPLSEYVQGSDRILLEKLRALGLISRKGRRAMRRRMPHAIGHGLGIDAHDSLGGFETFQPGMVLTVEPGIYVPEREFGVRIENDILVTEDGHRNLSGALPIDIAVSA